MTPQEFSAYVKNYGSKTAKVMTLSQAELVESLRDRPPTVTSTKEATLESLVELRTDFTVEYSGRSWVLVHAPADSTFITSSEGIFSSGQRSERGASPGPGVSGVVTVFPFSRHPALLIEGAGPNTIRHTRIHKKALREINGEAVMCLSWQTLVESRSFVERFKVDREMSMPWVESSQAARMMDDILSRIGEPRPGSFFEQTNALYPWDEVSNWARDYLNAGIEHLLFWADSTVPLRFHPETIVTHRLRPVQALARASVESAAQGVWLMEPDTSRKAALRLLALILHDYEEERKALPLDKKQRMHDARTELLARVAMVTNETEIGHAPNYMDMVKIASVAASSYGVRSGISDPVEVERLWRSSAGSAHGKRWPLVALQVRVPAARLSDGTYQTATMPDPDAITKILKLAEAVVTYGVIRFGIHSGYELELPQMLTDAAGRLYKNLPRDDAHTPTVS